MLAVAALVLATSGAARAADDLAWDPAVTRGELPNGMEYFIMKNAKPEKRVEFRLLVRAGSVHETDVQQGIAHFIEHMGFNGTEHFAAGDLIKYFESVGVEFGPDTNAYTSFDHTMYMLSLPVEPEPLEKGLLAMRDYAGGMLFLPEEVEKEKGVVLEELRLGRDMYTRIIEKALGIALKGSRYAERMPIGKKENIEAFDAVLCKEFYTANYRPDNMAFVVVGDIDPKDMEQKIKDTFGTLPRPDQDFELTVFKDVPHDDLYAGIVTDRELPLSMIFVTYTREPSPVRTQNDYRAQLAETLAVNIYNKRLEEITLSGNAPFKEAYGSADWSMKGFDVVTAYAQTDMKKERAALERLMTEIERMRRHGALEQELEEVKSDLAESLRVAVAEKDKRESAPLAGNIAMSWFNGEPFLEITAEKALFDSLRQGITIDDARRAIEEVFAPVNMAALMILPEFQKSLYKEKDIVAAVESASGADIPAYARQETVKTTDYSKLVPGKVADRKEFKDTGVTAVTFDNGLRVLIKPTDFQEDEILIAGFAPGGVLHETPADRGVGRLAIDAWTTGGTAEFDSVQIGRLMSGKSISIHAMGRENFSLGGATVNKDFEETLQWLRDYLDTPGYRDEAVAKIKSLTIDQIKQAEADQTGSFRLEMTRQLCPGHPMSYMPSVEQVERITPDQLRAAHRLATAPANMEFTFVGNLDVEKTIALTARYLGSLPARDAAALAPDVMRCDMPEGLTKRVIRRGIEPRTQIAVLFAAPPVDSPDAPAVKAMAKIADTRMLKRLREELSGTYYAYMIYGPSLVVKNRDQLLAAMATDPARVDEMLAEFDAIVNKLAEQGPTQDELKAAKEVAKKDLEEDLKRNDYWAQLLNSNLEMGRAPDVELALARAVQNVTAEQVRAAAKKYLLGETRIEVIALPAEVPPANPGDK
jgi:zinc protease